MATTIKTGGETPEADGSEVETAEAAPKKKRTRRKKPEAEPAADTAAGTGDPDPAAAEATAKMPKPEDEIPEPKGAGNKETNVTGEAGPEISEEEKRRRAEILAAQLAEIDGEDSEKKKAQDKQKAEADAAAVKRSTFGTLYSRWGLGLHTYDNHFTIRGSETDRFNPTPHISNAQLKALLLTAALEKNWTKIYFYKDNATIDPALTSRAQQMLIELGKPGQPLHGINMMVSPIRMRDVEPWNEKRPLYGYFRAAANTRDDAILGVKNFIRSTWNGAVVSTMFNENAKGVVKAGKTLGQPEVDKDAAAVVPPETAQQAPVTDAEKAAAEAAKGAAKADPAAVQQVAEAATVNPTEIPATRKAKVAAGAGPGGIA